MKIFGLGFRAILTVISLLASIAGAAPIPVVAVHQDASGVTLKMQRGVLRLEVFSPRIIRVVYGQGETLPPTSSLAVIAKPGARELESERNGPTKCACARMNWKRAWIGPPARSDFTIQPGSRC